MQIAVLGLGNLMRTDDAVGMMALDDLRRDCSLPDDVLWIEGGTLGLDLLDALRGVTHLLALDAVDTGTAPGSIVCFANSELSQLPVSKSAHLLGFSDLLNVLQLLGDRPEQVVLLGVQPAATGWGTTLTPQVETAKRNLIQVARSRIIRWQSDLTGAMDCEAAAACNV
ncbi:MAG TPA: hydrogenase maturation protease [Acidobacteriaceae bacterium]|nr:hydrogenase maturation protease [Acidobacteriaceae bacterium]